MLGLTPWVTGLPPGMYYPAILHFNHLPLMLGGPELLSPDESLIDFTLPAQVFDLGTPPMILPDGSTAMHSGDANGDGANDAADRTKVWNDRNQTGYLPGDLNRDGVIDAADRANAWNKRNLQGSLP